MRRRHELLTRRCATGSNRVMLDVLDAAFYDPRVGRAYFVRGDRFIEYAPRRGVVALPDGRRLRRLGVDGWTALPDELRDGVDAARYFPPERAVCWFRGGDYVMYGAAGPVALDGRILRRLGIDGWRGIPDAFRGGIDAALYDAARGTTQLFRG